MNTGKLTEAVEGRSVNGIIGKKGFEPIGTVIQELKEKHRLVHAAAEARIEYRCQAGFLIDQVAAQLCAKGIDVPVLEAGVLLPLSWDEAALKEFIRCLKQEMEKRGFEDYMVHVRGLPEISVPVLSISGSGLVTSPEIPSVNNLTVQSEVLSSSRLATPPEISSVNNPTVQPGALSESFIVMAGYAALEATACIISAKRQELLTRLSGSYLNEALEKALQTDIRPAVRTAKAHGALVYTAGEGGIFQALWGLGQSLNCGMKISLSDILLLQETIEVCEILDINPYLMLSTGSILAVLPQPEQLLAAYRESNIPAAKIGRLCAGHDRVLVHGEDHRFLEPFRGDEIFKAGILH